MSESEQNPNNEGPKIPEDQMLFEEYAAIFPNIVIPKDKVKKSPTNSSEYWQAFSANKKNGAPRAICLSGGGIRSATFALGVLQGLAKAGGKAEKDASGLDQFHYLSTVSGGGYIGSWLSRSMQQGKSFDELLIGTNAATGAMEPIKRLRSFSSYLSPVWGLSADTLTGFTIFLRNLFFNLLFWVPLLLAIATIPRIVIAGINYQWQPIIEFSGYLFPSTYLAAVALPMAVFCIWALAGLLVLLSVTAGESFREMLSRRAAQMLPIAVIWLLAFGLFIYLPNFVTDLFNSKNLDSPAAVWFSGGGLIIVSGFIGFWSQKGRDFLEKSRTFSEFLGLRFIDVMAAVALIAIAIVIGLIVGYLIENVMSGTMLKRSGRLFLILLACVAIIAFFVRSNRFSLHSLYGNRLIRAYLGNTLDNRNPDSASDMDPEDDIALSALWPTVEERGNKLFHVVNMTLNLTLRSKETQAWQERKGASFIATPLHCGSAVTGYAATSTYGGGITLGRAMTISGAAVAPNMGYNSSPLMTFLMTLFNIRLGLWQPHPNKNIPRAEPVYRISHFWREALSRTKKDSDWLYLSDGGHFDNLGIYEMVRRRCRLIVAIDASCDGGFQHSDLHEACRKIAVDFGVPIELPPTLPGQPGAGERQRVVVGSIRYDAIDKDYENGFLVVLKPLLLGNEPPSLTHYARTSRWRGNTFPHHSTVDQFFDETQFESYRHLGEFSARDLLNVLDTLHASGWSNATQTIRSQTDDVIAAYPMIADKKDLVETVREAEKDKSGDKIPVQAQAMPAVLSGIDGLIAAVKSLGTGGLALGALAAAGTVTVAGNVGVKLSDVVWPKIQGTIELDENASKLAKGVVLTADAEALESIGTLIDRIEKLLKAPKTEPDSGKGRLPVTVLPPPPDQDDLTLRMAELRGAVGQLSARVSAIESRPQSSPPDYRPLIKTLGDLIAKVNQPEWAIKHDEKLTKSLDGIRTELQNIQARIESAGRIVSEK